MNNLISIFIKELILFIIMSGGNIALLFFGIHYQENMYINSNAKYPHRIDFRYYVKNIREKFIDYFKQFYNIDIFVSTNESPIQNEVLQIYQPKKYSFYNQRGRNTKIKKGLQLIIEYMKEKGILYNAIAIMRFDIYFLKNFLLNQNMYMNKLNLVSILEQNNMVDDNFYLFPISYLYNMYEIFCTCTDKTTLEAHSLKKIFDKYFKINYICNEHTFVAKLSFYKLRYFCDIDFIINSGKLQENLTYYSKFNNSSLFINNNDIYFEKLNYNPCHWCWIGYNIEEEGKYNLSFDIKSDTWISGFPFIKTHNPVLLYDCEDIIQNQWKHISININVESNYELLVIIFDDFISKINIVLKNIQIIRI
jgi:hypothetical protein